jgi:hypothetical protein
MLSNNSDPLMSNLTSADFESDFLIMKNIVKGEIFVLIIGTYENRWNIWNEIDN